MNSKPTLPTTMAAITLSGMLMQPASAITAMYDPLHTAAIHEWTLVTSFSYSFFNHGYDSWHKESVDIYRFLPDQKLLLGFGVDYDERSSGRDDILYDFNATWYATKKLELHAATELTPDADFLPSQQYSLGMAYQVSPHLELLFDIDQLNFRDDVANWEDGITQIRPGVTWWFDEHNRVTLRYIHGWVHDYNDYDYYSAKFHFGEIIRDGTLSVGLAYGTDPDYGFTPGTTSLSEAYLLSVFYTEPVNDDLTVFFGVEYVYRMRPDSNQELYQMWTPTIGLSWKF